jgi:hypothetical protein
LNQLLIAAAVLLAVVVLTLATRRWFRRFQLQRRWSRARKIERQASALLDDLGYQVLDSQVETTYDLLVDGERSTVKLRADYLVSRSGRRFVAEVKSGQSAPRLDTAATRRQLLEYWAVFQVDGILLVDGESRQVHEITFPTPNRSKGRGAVYGFVVGLAVSLAFIFWVLFSNLAFSSGPAHAPHTGAHPARSTGS